MSGDEDGDDGEEIFGELLFGRTFAWIRLAENQEWHSCTSEDPFDEFHSEASESISVGNHHNSGDNSLLDLFQKGDKATSVPVKARADILDEFGLGELGLEVRDLSFEIGSLW